MEKNLYERENIQRAVRKFLCSSIRERDQGSVSKHDNEVEKSGKT